MDLRVVRSPRRDGRAGPADWHQVCPGHDRYIRVRAGHPRAADAWLWLGTKGRLTASASVR